MVHTTTLNRSTSPICKDSTAGTLQICLTLPQCAREANPTRFVQDRDSSTPSSDELMRYDGVYLQSLYIQGRFNIIVRHMERGGLLGRSGEDILSEAGGQMPGSVFRVMGIHARFASHDRDASLSARASQTRWQVQIKKLVSNRPPIRGRFARSSTKNLKGASPVQRKFRLQCTLTLILITDTLPWG